MCNPNDTLVLDFDWRPANQSYVAIFACGFSHGVDELVWPEQRLGKGTRPFAYAYDVSPDG